jgi:DNA-binding transcriptional LysR family regulator
MDINRLQYFCTIINSGSLRKASEIIGVSSPALSKAMKQLEEEVGVQLFNQEGRQLIPTDKGRLLAKEGLKLLTQVSDLRDTLLEDESIDRPIKIATFEVFSTYFLSFLNGLDWDDRQIEFHEVLPGELERAVANNLVDFGLSYMPVAHPGLDFLKVTSIEMGVFTHESAFKNIDQKELPFVVPVSPLFSAPTRVRGLDGWPENAYNRKIKYQVTLMETALELCRQGRCAGYFPVFIVEEHNKKMNSKNQLRRCESPYKDRTCTTDVFIIKRNSDQEDKTIKQLAKGIRNICGHKA